MKRRSLYDLDLDAGHIKAYILRDLPGFSYFGVHFYQPEEYREEVAAAPHEMSTCTVTATTQRYGFASRERALPLR